MEPLAQGVDADSVDRSMETWHQLPAEEDPSQLLQHTSGLPETVCEHRFAVSHEGQMSIVQDTSMQPVADRFASLQLAELQDSCLSPVLTLIPQGKPFIPSESTLLHQTELEFAPLRGSPDLSVFLERCPRMSHLDADIESNHPDRSLEQASLSQHPLGVTTAISEDVSSCCSLSQHSLSPNSDYQASWVHEKKSGEGLGKKYERLLDGELGDSISKGVGVASSVKVTLVSKNAFSQSGAAPIALNTPEEQSIHCNPTCKDDSDFRAAEKLQVRLSGGRKQPQGGCSSSVSNRKTMGSVETSLSSRMSAISNITVRSTRMQPDETTDFCHRQLELQSDAAISALGSTNQIENKIPSSAQYVSSASVCEPGLTRASKNSARHPAADGSFLTSQPVSQSTPAVLFGRGAPVPAALTPIYSQQNTEATSAINQIPALDLSNTNALTIPDVSHATSLDPAEVQKVSNIHSGKQLNQEAYFPKIGVLALTREDGPFDPHTQSTGSTSQSTSDRELSNQELMLSSRRVHSLPSLDYLQKVDAWKASQSSSRSFHDLALQGFAGVSTKRKAQDSASETINIMLSQQSLDNPSRAINISGFSHKDLAEAGGAVQTTPASPLTHSHSHSSLGTVMVPVQQDDSQNDLQLPPVHSLAITQGNNSTAAESSDERMADRSKTDPVKTPSLIGLGHFGDLPTNLSMISTLPSFKGSCYGEQSFHESVGAASSVVSLEVDNYAPYWTSRPSSPPRSFELNIEDRIPLYLRNLGIDQSPSTILNPFTRRGPIREPEFSPTDLCTIKDSVGTPTKSTLPSEGDSPQKATFSSSSVLSSDSSSSLTQQEVQKPDRPASPGSVRMIHRQTSTPPKSQTSYHACSVPKESDTPQREGSYGLPAQLSLDSGPPPGTCLEVREGDSSLVGSATLQEIRHLLGRAESLVSAQSSLTSSPGSHFYSESDASLLSLRQNTQMCHDDSSLSTSGRNSLVLARSSSDSALKQSSSSSCGAPRLSTPSHHMTNAPLTVCQSREENLKSRDLDVAPRRAEPEGCSAADPDRVAPVSLSVKKMNAITTSYDQQQSQDSAEDAGVSSSIVSPSHSSAEMELGTPLGSDSASDCSLAARVAKLLQSESSVSVITSRPSTTDTEKSRAGAEVMVKVSGGECKVTGLNTEDRKRIEEIKRELLLHTKQSSDSESSVQSSVGTLSRPTVGFAAVRSAEDRLTEQLQQASKISLDLIVPSHAPPQPSLEDRVRQIAFREGISLTPPLPSVSTATIWQTPSPQPTSQRLHVHDVHGTHEDAVPDNKSHQLMRSDEESKLQTQGLDKTTEKEGMGIVGKDNERKDKNERQENKRPDALAVQERAIEDITVEREIPPGLESASPSAHTAQMSDIHLNLSSNLKQKTTQTRTSDASTYSQLQNGPPAHQSDRMSSQNALENVPSPVFNTSKEQHPTVSSETSLRKDKNVDQDQNTRMVGGYSQKSYRHQQAYMNAQTLAGSSRALSVQAAAIPLLLPYKPHGSSELFYMPKTDQELSPNTSETTMESSHPGSDDAVPPRFSTEVLGSREIQDRNVTPKHKEGIYSRRAKMNRESTVSGKGFCDSKVAAFSQKDCTGPVYQLTSSNFSGEPVNNQVAVHITEQNEDGFVQLNMEVDYSTDDQHYHSNTVRKQNLPPETLPLPTKAARNVGEDRKVRDISVEIASSLDQLWHRFNRSYSLQESRPLNEGEVSLLERLERLSRLLHSPSLPHTSAKQPGSQVENDKNMRRDPETEMRNVQNKEVNTKEKKERSRRVKSLDEVKRLPKIAWEDKALRTSKALVEDVQQENDRHYPAERDESASVSVETSSSRSTIDTQRLLRAFGPLRVCNGGEESTSEKQTSGSLLKVYNTIHKQKTGNGKAYSKHHHVSVATETSSTDESRVSFDTLSSSSTYSLPSQRGTRGCSSKRRKVKLVSRGIQAGDLEIVVNGTRRHTRDVGTTFPSPGCAKDIRVPAANSVSWFVSADEMKMDARKENKPQSDSMLFKNQAWFEPYSRVHPWREPLRERHIQEQRETPTEHTTSSENGTSHKPSALVYLSLQEALEFHRPGFVSRSRERMKRLCLLAEERKMQAVYNKEREELFNQPLQIQRPAAASAPAAPPAPAPSKRVIPVSEMVQRSKRIYSQLPEVQKRKEEERRKMEYRTYRLNAQLFNKKITNRVLGKRAPWQ